ncbi:MAG: hypothetical protein U1D30_16590 [Planctomycetota bacterium]
MAWFRCFVRGENFPGQLLSQEGLIGFYVTRFIEAEDAADAEMKCVELLRQETKIAPPPGFTPTGKARIYFEEIEALVDVLPPEMPPGFVFFPMDEPESKPGLFASLWRKIRRAN